MTLNFNATITVDAKKKTKAIFDSINTDNEFYPENPTKTDFKLNKKIMISSHKNCQLFLIYVIHSFLL